MIILDTTTRSLELDLNTAITTNQLPFVASWADVTSSTTTPGTTTGQSNSTTAVTLVAAPSASTQRIVKYISVKNNDTVDCLLWIQVNDNSTLRELVKVTLNAQDTLEYIEGQGWSVLNTSGQKKSISSISGNVTVVQSTATNLKVDASGVAVPITDNSSSLTVDGSVTVTQGTGSNLHAVIDSGTVTTITNVVHVDDNSSSLTVDGTITANAGTNLNTSALALESGGNLATLAGVVRAEDAASADGHTGIAALAVRKATPANTSGTDGDYENLQVSAGRLWTSAVIDTALPAGNNNIGDVDVVTLPAVTNGGTFAVQDSQVIADNAGFTDGTSKLFMAGYIYDDTAGTALTENDAAAPRVSSNRATVAAIEDGATRARYATVTASNALKVDNSAVTQPISGTVTASNTAGDIAHDAADSGNPVKQGAVARTSDITAVANADRVNLIADTLGKLVVLQGAVHDMQVNGTANYTNTTAADVIAAAGAGVRIAVTSVLVTNGHATVSTKVEIRDGTTVKIQGYAVAAGGGFSLNAGGRPLFISTANTAVTARNVTTGSDVDVSISGYKIAN